MSRNLAACVVGLATVVAVRAGGEEPGAKTRKVSKTEKEWAQILTRDQFYVCRQKGTEPAFSGKYVSNHSKGVYTCVACGAELFGSQTKFESGTGWPSFWKPIRPAAIDSEIDYRNVEPRVEVMCRDCGAHLGHVFDDGPPPTGQRFCMNSVALRFVRATDPKAKPKAKAKATTEEAPAPAKP